MAKLPRPLASDVIRVAGGRGETRRRGDANTEPGPAFEVLVVHRPRDDDWSLPKGKVERGESDEDAARREVEEETGYVCALGEELPTIRYIDRRKRDKQVRFWNMTVTNETAWAPNDEVDERRWISPAVAATLLTYEADRRLVQTIAALDQ